MSRYTSQPTLSTEILLPSKMSFDTPGGGMDGGRNGYGEAITINLSGGGMLIGSYENCFIRDPEQHEYVNMLAARLNSGVRFINVPILTDWVGPFPILDGVAPTPIIEGIPHSDGALFLDGAGYSQATVWGEIVEDASLNAGSIRMRVFNPSRTLRHSDWFSIYHGVKGWRAYRYWEQTARYDDGVEVIAGTAVPFQEYQLAIEIPMREAVVAGTRVEFARPRCVMKFRAGFSLPWEVEGFYESSPSLQFSEAF